MSGPSQDRSIREAPLFLNGSFGFCQVREDEEDFKDILEEDNEEDNFVGGTADGPGPPKFKPTASWVHHQNLEGVWFWFRIDEF